MTGSFLAGVVFGALVVFSAGRWAHKHRDSPGLHEGELEFFRDRGIL